MMKYKRGIQLSVTFLVIIIITMTVFSMSLYLIRQFFVATQEVEKQITADIQREVERRLAETGERVAIPLNKRNIKPGTSHAFGLGILNTGETSTFHIKIEFADPGHYTSDGEAITDPGSRADANWINENWIFTDILPITLQNNEQAVIPLTVRVDKRMTPDSSTAENSVYVFNVCVAKQEINFPCQSGAQENLYTNKIYKIYAEVK